jgi:type IV secretion system protein TrbB
MQTVSGSSESQARRNSALASALLPIADFLADDRVVEVMANADGVVWVDRLGEGLLRTDVQVAPGDVERMLRLVAAEMLLELNAQHTSLSAKLPPPWSARLQGYIPPSVDAPAFALRKPASLVFSLDDYVARGIVRPAQQGALVQAVHARDNILIGDSTGSGKTTFANALLRVVADRTRRFPSVGQLLPARGRCPRRAVAEPTNLVFAAFQTRCRRREPRDCERSPT